MCLEREIDTLRGYVATGLRGYVATWLRGLRGYVATWLRGYVATRLRGYAATRLRGYRATGLRGYVAQLQNTRPLTPSLNLRILLPWSAVRSRLGRQYVFTKCWNEVLPRSAVPQSMNKKRTKCWNEALPRSTVPQSMKTVVGRTAKWKLKFYKSS